MGCSLCTAQDPVDSNLRVLLDMQQEHYRAATEDGLAAGVAAALAPDGDASAAHDQLESWMAGRAEQDSAAAANSLHVLDPAIDHLLLESAPQLPDGAVDTGAVLAGHVSEADAQAFLSRYLALRTPFCAATASFLAYEELRLALEQLRRCSAANTRSATECALRSSIESGDVSPQQLRQRLEPHMAAVRRKYQQMLVSYTKRPVADAIRSAVAVAECDAEGRVARADLLAVVNPLLDRTRHLRLLRMLGLEVKGDARVCGVCGCDLTDTPVPAVEHWGSLTSSTHEGNQCDVCGRLMSEGSSMLCHDCNFDVCMPCYSSTDSTIGGALRELRTDDIWVRTVAGDAAGQ